MPTTLRPGLEWEKKETAYGSGDDGGNLHDVDNQYVWWGVCSISSMPCQPTAAASALCTAQTGGALGCAQCGPTDGTCLQFVGLTSA